MFRIKICGITRPQDAMAAADAGADAIGLNFYPQSPRHVSDRQAAEVVAAAGSLTKVGVFVNAPVDTIRRQAESLPLDWIQLHGDEPETLIEALADLAILRAVRLGPDDVTPLRRAIAASRAGGPRRAVLVDARRAGAFGGSGVTLDWEGLANAYDASPGDPPLVLAGGLTPENVAQAIAVVRPAAVDAASGVESAPGIKDAQRMRRFVSAALPAWSF